MAQTCRKQRNDHPVAQSATGGLLHGQHQPTGRIETHFAQKPDGHVLCIDGGERSSYCRVRGYDFVSKLNQLGHSNGIFHAQDGFNRL